MIIEDKARASKHRLDDLRGVAVSSCCVITDCLDTFRKNLLVDAASFGDLTSDKYADIQKRINAALQSVSPAEEYREFTEKHRLAANLIQLEIKLKIQLNSIRSSAALPVIFRFDDQLIEDTVGKLQPNQLTVDNLTVDWLRQRITELESSIKECQEKQSKIHSESNGKISSSASSLQASPASQILSNSLSTAASNMNGSNGSLKDIK